MTTRHFALAVCLAVSLLAPSASSAQAAGTGDGSELEAEARARFSLGQLYYSQARFGEAATEFEAAYALHAHPLLLHNVYLARRDMGDFPGALDALTRYLATATDLSAADRRVLEGRLAAMQRQVALQTPAPTPQPDPPVDPVVGDATPAPGETTSIADPLPPLPAHGDDGLMTGAIVSFSLAGAAAVTMLITGPLALTERDHLASTCAPSCSDDQVSTARTLGLVTDVALSIGAVAAATGIVLAILGATSSHSSTGGDVSVTPSVSSDHAALVVGGHF